MKFIQIIRPINLVLVALTQCLIYFFVFVPISIEAQIPLLLQSGLIYGLILDTVIIAAAGYVINDLIDIDIDRINKGNKQLVTNKISAEHTRYYYYFLLSIGAILALWIAYSINNLSLFLIYPIASFMLFGYSLWWKKQAWTGNIVVSLFTALVPFILLFAEREFVSQLTPTFSQYIYLKIGGFMIFAFLLNMIREIIKDMEDIEGDRAAKYHTAAIVYTESTIKMVCKGLLLANCMGVFIMAYFIKSLDNNSLFIGVLMFCILLLHIIVFKNISTATTSKNYHYTSQIIKVLMLIGLILFILI